MSNRDRVAADLVAAALTAIAFLAGRWATADLSWPVEIDHFRDMGAAQSLLDGDWGSDPAFLGERAWYSPLTPALFAAAHALTAIPLPELVARGGAFVNLLAPLSFYLLARLLLGGWTAVAALAGFLFFVDPAIEPWAQATYGPWPWPVCFVQALFYLTAAAWWCSLRSRRRRWDLATGALLGVTFLGHVAPAAILAGAVSLVALHGAWRSTDRRRHLERWLTVGLLAALVSAPHLLPLLAHYGVGFENPVPSRRIGVATRDLVAGLVGLRPALAAVGVWAIVRGWGGQARAMLAALAAVILLLLGHGMAADVLGYRGIALPTLVPTFHFYFYLTALLALAFGVGLAALAERARWPRRRPLLVPVLAGLLSIALYLRYWRAPRQTGWREASLAIARDEPITALYAWSRAHAGPADVFLTDDRLGMHGVVAAGRKVVSLAPSMSNPYLRHDTRDRDRRAMFDLLRRGEEAAFRELAARYRVTYVVSAPDTEDDCCALEPPLPDLLEPVHRHGELRIYRLR